MESRTKEEIMEEIDFYGLTDRFKIILLEILVDTRDELHDIKKDLRRWTR